MNKKMGIAGSLLAATLMLSASANAGVVFLNGNNPQPDEENILFNGAGSNPGPALTVTGRTNHTSTVVTFTSDELLITPSMGQARVDAKDGAFQLLTVALENNGTFGDLIFNLNTPNKLKGTAVISVLTDTGTETYNLTVGNGNNFLTILATDATRISSVTIDSRGNGMDLKAIDIDDGRQFRISGLGGTPVPEPGTLALFAAGLFGIQRLRRRYNK